KPPPQQHMLPFSIDSYCPPKTLIHDQFKLDAVFMIADKDRNPGNNIRQENIVFFDNFDNSLQFRKFLF
ncbi:MAG TPA: hypothetical protein DCQ10_00315, partial [Rhodobacteraceae bacterium]|nr:hypothetical protein [Paracoccaceae bacterium]